MMIFPIDPFINFNLKAHMGEPFPKIGNYKNSDIRTLIVTKYHWQVLPSSTGESQQIYL